MTVLILINQVQPISRFLILLAAACKISLNKVSSMLFSLHLQGFCNNMIRRTAAYVFIFLANIVLLAHAVIPHHHHKDEICIVNSLYQQEKELHRRFDAKEDCKHEGDRDLQICVLKNQAVAFPQKSLKQGNNCADNLHPYPTYQAIEADQGFGIQLFGISVIRHINTNLKTCSCLSGSISLRAPPIV